MSEPPETVSVPVSLLSVENTGTHFTADVISRLTGHTWRWEWATPSNEDAFNTPDIGVLVQHVYPPDFLSHANAIVTLMLRADRVVVPMRDPVKALISNHDRGHENLPFADHVRSFERVADWDDVHFFQVDPEPENRALEVWKLAEYLDVDPKPVPWKPKNATPASKWSELRLLYRENRFSELDEALNGAISALEPLSGFFSRFGYEIPVLGAAK